MSRKRQTLGIRILNISKFCVAPFLIFAFAVLNQPCCTADDAVIVTDSVASSWKIHQKSGRLFSIQKDYSGVIEYGVDGREIRRFETPRMAVSMLVHSRFLVVHMDAPSELIVFDLDRNQKHGGLSLEGELTPFGGMTSAETETPFIYAYSRLTPSAKIIQIDLQDLSFRNQLQDTLLVNKTSGIRSFEISRDGKFISARSGSNYYQWAFNESDCRFSKIVIDKPEGLRRYEFNFGNRWQEWVEADNLKRRGGMFYSGQFLCRHPVLDISVFHFSSSSLRYLQSGRRIVSRNLPAQMKRQNISIAIFHLKEKKLFVASSNRATWVSYDTPTLEQDRGSTPKTLSFVNHKQRSMIVEATNNLPREIAFFANQTPTYRFDIPSNIAIRFSTQLPGNRIQRNAVVSDDSKDVEIRENEISWTPGFDSPSQKTVVLDFYDKSDHTISVQKVIDLRVALDSIQFDFKVKKMAVSASKRWGAVYGEGSEFPRQNESPAYNRMALVDLASKRIVADETILTGVRDIEFLGEQLLLIPSQGNFVYSVDRKAKIVDQFEIGFAPVGFQKVLLSQQADKQIARVADARFGSADAQAKAKVRLDNSPSAAVVNKEAAESTSRIYHSNRIAVLGNSMVQVLGLGRSQSNPIQSNPIQDRDKWQKSQDRILKPQSKTTEPNNLTARQIPFTNRTPIRKMSNAEKFWGINAASRMNSTIPEDLIKDATYSSPILVFEEIPGALFYVFKKRRQRYNIQFFMVSLGSPSKLFASRFFDAPAGTKNFKDMQTVELDRQVGILNENFLTFFPLPKSLFQNVNPIPMISIPQAVIVTADAPGKIQIPNRHFVGTEKFYLAKKVAGISIDPKSKSIAVDFNQAWKQALKSLSVVRSNKGIELYRGSAKHPIWIDIANGAFDLKETNIPLGAEQVPLRLNVPLAFEVDGEIQEKDFEITLVGPKRDLVEWASEKLYEFSVPKPSPEETWAKLKSKLRQLNQLEKQVEALESTIEIESDKR